MSEREMADMIVSIYLALGGSVDYAYQVAGLFVRAVREGRARRAQEKAAA